MKNDEEMLPYHLFRSSDPDTSEEAAYAILPRLGPMQVWVAKQVVLRPSYTKRELSTMLGLDTTSMRRMNECYDRGMVSMGAKRPCTITGKRAYTWYAPWVMTMSQAYLDRLLYAQAQASTSAK